MSLIDFAKAIAGLGMGAIVTASIFGIGYAFVEDVLFEENPCMFILVMAVLIWITVSYGVITWVM